MDITLNWGPVASLKYKKARKLFKAGEYAKSAEVLVKDLTKKRNKFGYYALGQCFVALQDYAKVAQSLLEAVKIDKTYHEALGLLGDIYFLSGQHQEGFSCYMQAVAADPSNAVYKQKLVNLVCLQKFNTIHEDLKNTLIECMKDERTEMFFMGQAWLSIVKQDALTGPYYKLCRHKDYSSFEKDMQSFDNCDGLIDTLFLIGLGKFIVTDVAFENWIKFLRRYLLKNIVEGKGLFTEKGDIERVICAFSCYCFLSDYIMSYSSEEEAMLEKLEKKVNVAGANPELADLACYGCYKPLNTLPNAVEIAAQLKGGDHASHMPKSQIEDYYAQQDIRGEIETLVKIENETSKAVREQYETFPYPRWSVATMDTYDPQMEGFLKGTKAEILIAGCGTGKEAIYVANVFPDAQITAVDLSKASLSYAIFKSRQMGIKNIKFYQADIMTLGDLPDWQGRFDYITSTGVLHHMKDPFAGWKVLSGLLKDRGMMRIGLYSRRARWVINEARSAIESKNIGSDSMAIREFRDNIETHLENEAIKSLGFSIEYYNLSECRDLLFHVQEHQFDLLQVKEHLDTLGFEFLKFYLGESVVEKYKSQNAIDPEGTNLEIWDKWEQENPETFVEMYRFWCRKTD